MVCLCKHCLGTLGVTFTSERQPFRRIPESRQFTPLREINHLAPSGLVSRNSVHRLRYLSIYLSTNASEFPAALHIPPGHDSTSTGTNTLLFFLLLSRLLLHFFLFLFLLVLIIILIVIFFLPLLPYPFLHSFPLPSLLPHPSFSLPPNPHNLLFSSSFFPLPFLHSFSHPLPPHPPPPHPPPTENTRRQQTTVPRSAEDKKDISVLNTNARSRIPKRDELLAYIDVEKPDVVAIAETWATSDHLMSEFSIPRYESFYKNRLHKKGGSVICYVKNKYQAVKITKEDSDKYDTVYVEPETSKHNKITNGTVHRPPKQQAVDDAALYEEIHTITQNKQSDIIGDFNCSKIDWTTLHGDREGNKFLEMLEDTILTQIVIQPTRENNL